MKNIKFVELYRTLSDRELRNFEKFASLTYFNKGRDFAPVLKALRTVKKKNSFDVTRAKFYELAYKGKSYNAQTLKNRFSELLHLAEIFLINNRLEQKHLERESILIEEYFERNIGQLLEKKFSKYESMCKAEPLNADILLKSALPYYTFARWNFYQGKTKTFYKYFYEYQQKITGSFLSELFGSGGEYSQQRFLGVGHRFGLFEYLLKLLKSTEFEKHLNDQTDSFYIITRLQYHLFNAYSSASDNSFFEAEKILKSNITGLSDEYIQLTFNALIYYAIIQMNSGKEEFTRIIFNLYNERVEFGIEDELSRNSFPVNSFRDHVFIGLKLCEYQWTKRFIEQFAKYLPEEKRETEVKLSMAKLLFAQKNFAEAYNYLAAVIPDNFIHFSDVSILSMKLCYSLDNFEECYRALDRTAAYYRSHKEVPAYYRKRDLIFCTIFRKLLKRKIFPEKSDKSFDEITKNTPKPVTDQKWFTERFRELDERASKQKLKK